MVESSIYYLSGSKFLFKVPLLRQNDFLIPKLRCTIQIEAFITAEEELVLLFSISASSFDGFTWRNVISESIAIKPRMYIEGIVTAAHHRNYNHLHRAIKHIFLS